MFRHVFKLIKKSFPMVLGSHENVVGSTALTLDLTA